MPCVCRHIQNHLVEIPVKPEPQGTAVAGTIDDPRFGIVVHAGIPDVMLAVAVIILRVKNLEVLSRVLKIQLKIVDAIVIDADKLSKGVDC
ncbi:hypothetical protein SDC9_197710 [bioreactor metagenome]|uniref:Uncharacterized protein n=1 Tax=bioreactor metagenome TaxID=1076179 RepID=A0A645IP13_9ZZZZ